MPTIGRAQLYPLDEVIKTIYAATIKADPPRVAPLQLVPIVAFLEDVTNKSREHLQRLQHSISASSGVLPGRGDILKTLDGIRTDLMKWEPLLASYRLTIDACITAGKGEDAECSLWAVVAPLFFGIYDGPLGTSSPATPSLRMPFQIANQLHELQHFEDTEYSDAWRYIGEETGKTFAAITEAAAGTLRLLAEAAGKAVAGAAGGLLEGLGPIASLLGIVLAGWWIFGGKED